MREYCKMFQNLHDSCKNLTRHESLQRIKTGYYCRKEHYEADYCLLTKVQSRNESNKNFARILNLVRNLHAFRFGKKCECFWQPKLTKNQMCECADESKNNRWSNLSRKNVLVLAVLVRILRDLFLSVFFFNWIFCYFFNSANADPQPVMQKEEKEATRILSCSKSQFF